MEDRLPPLTFRPAPSCRTARILYGLQCLALGVLVAAPIQSGVRLLLLVLLLVTSLHAVRQLSGRSSSRITEVRIDASYATRLVFADGNLLQTSLRGDSVMANGLILLRFEGEGFLRSPSLLLDRESLSADEMRRLRVMLKAGRRGLGKDRKGFPSGESAGQGTGQ